MKIVELGYQQKGTCEICNRKRDITMRLELSGKNYVHDDLSEMENPEIEQEILMIGRNCSYRAEYFHEIYHFHYDIYGQIKEKMENLRRRRKITRSLDRDPHCVPKDLNGNQFY